MTSARDNDLVAEQREFYEADAVAFDSWLVGLSEEANQDPTAVRYRAGRARASELFRARAPLGRVLEIAGGTGHLAEIYGPHATEVLLLDSSRSSLRLAERRLSTVCPSAELIDADVFTWQADGRTFDTIVFSAWLHHVPESLFAAFWNAVTTWLAPGGTVIFDFPDARHQAPGRKQVPDAPSEGYAMYAPVNGISIRDHFGTRWRVVHLLWHPDDLVAALAGVGLEMELIGPGLFGNVLWAAARRAG